MGWLDDAYCLDCHARMYPKLRRRGSGWTAFVLLLFGILPGIAFMIWRAFHWERICETCGSKRIVPADSETAKEALRARSH